MKNIKQITLDKYLDSNFESLEKGIYKNIEEDIYVFAIAFELEENENSQYPLEDLLDKFYLHISDFIDEEAFNNSKSIELELGGDLEDVQLALESIIEKRIYNSEYTDEDGKTYKKLVIE